MKVRERDKKGKDDKKGKEGKDNKKVAKKEEKEEEKKEENRLMCELDITVTEDDEETKKSLQIYQQDDVQTVLDEFCEKHGKNYLMLFNLSIRNKRGKKRRIK